jgi:hypothetical protein
MPTIQNNLRFSPGDATNANEINSNNNNIAAVSSTIDEENTNNEWCSRYHITYPAISLLDPRVFNSNFNMDSGTNAQGVNWNTYQVINLGTDFRHSAVNPGDFTLQPGETLRLHLDINVLDPQITIPFPDDNVGTGDGDDTYAFRFFYSTDGGNNYLAFNCESRYSVTILPRDPVTAPWDTILPVNAEPFQRWRQRCNHTVCFINTSNSAIAYTNFEARVKIENLAWIPSMTIDDGTFTMMIARN